MLLSGQYRVVHVRGTDGQLVDIYQDNGLKFQTEVGNYGRLSLPSSMDDMMLLDVVRAMQWDGYGKYTIFVRDGARATSSLHVGRYRHAWIAVERFGSSVVPYVDMLRNALVERVVPEERVVRRGRTNRVVVSVVDMDPQNAQPVDLDLSQVEQLLSDVAVVEQWTLESQWLFYGQFPAEPLYRAQQQRFEISDTDMSRLINVNQWRSLDSVGWNIVVLRIPQRYRPLTVVQSRSYHTSQMYIVPKWGGVILWNDDEENVEQAIHALVRYGVVGIGDGNTPSAAAVAGQIEPLRKWELDAMIRWWSGVRLIKAAETLVTLRNLVDKMVDIVVSADVSALIRRAIDSAQLAISAAEFNDYEQSIRTSSDSMWSAEEAFFHPSMLSLLYFPDSQKLAVYLPLLLPVSVTVVIGLLREIKVMRMKEKNRQTMMTTNPAVVETRL